MDIRLFPERKSRLYIAKLIHIHPKDVPPLNLMHSVSSGHLMGGGGTTHCECGRTIYLEPAARHHPIETKAGNQSRP